MESSLTTAGTGSRGICMAVVENLLTKLGISDEKAAEIAEVSIEYVREIA